MKEASPCGLASFLSYLLWQVTEEVALLVKRTPPPKAENTNI